MQMNIITMSCLYLKIPATVCNEREWERDRQTDRQTDRDRDRETESLVLTDLYGPWAIQVQRGIQTNHFKR